MNKKGGILLAIILVLVILIISIIVGGYCWTYSINTLLGWFGKPAIVKFWQGALIGAVPILGQASLPVAVVIWIIGLFI